MNKNDKFTYNNFMERIFAKTEELVDDVKG
jgi:hypothetical protein